MIKNIGVFNSDGTTSVFETLNNKDLIVITLYNINKVDNIYIDNLNINKVDDFIDSLIYSLRIKGTTKKRTNNKKLKIYYNNSININEVYKREYIIKEIIGYESISYEENNKYISDYIKYYKIGNKEFIKYKSEHQIYENSSKCITDHEYFMYLAYLNSKRSKYKNSNGCVLVKDNKILSTGYDKEVRKEKLTDYTSSYNKLLSLEYALYNYKENIKTLEGSKLYIVNFPDQITIRLILLLKLEEVIYLNEEDSLLKELLEENLINAKKFDKVLKLKL